MQSITALKPLLETAKNIVITTHPKPDGDAMGSSLGLYHYLLLKGHNVHVITPTDYPFFLHWLPGNGEVIVYPDQPQQSEKLIADADIIFCLDFNGLKRINGLGDVVGAAPGIKVMIDHHLEPEGFDDYRLWNAAACATAELVYDFMVQMGDKALLNKSIASCLYCGIMTDSGSFRFNSVTAHLHRVVADLIEVGADNARIHELVYDTYSESRTRFLGYCLKDKLQVFEEYRTALIALTQQDLDEYNVGSGDTEGIVNYALSINNIKFAAIIIDRAEIVKLSLRSKGEFPANEVAKKYFEGGGHHNAAGGQSQLSLEETVQKFISVLPEYKELLNV
ncbi:DHH family phosphoesterase [Solitalea canadensis]|uniref:Exopolyphosphatase-like enzyme n=1 Tax=Solitalea canadensis (strain ATCC 29591 / DSM 3403 / JCM 21819 / LMG 8368 / NBRC 15130 / NCIMB 12057 / USAM 9D) TaxID=929556 RepID=H8KN45_SOLCM|nr:DHH family phosphoesterase [Solitalea canadensis]AFD09378.1 exopolyphosphatase-like enzyme [Solitalea canadensis DSM 3403]